MIISPLVVEGDSRWTGCAEFIFDLLDCDMYLNVITRFLLPMWFYCARFKTFGSCRCRCRFHLKSSYITNNRHHLDRWGAIPHNMMYN